VGAGLAVRQLCDMNSATAAAVCRATQVLYALTTPVADTFLR